MTMIQIGKSLSSFIVYGSRFNVCSSSRSIESPLTGHISQAILSTSDQAAGHHQTRIMA